jgi:hypothetical protein
MATTPVTPELPKRRRLIDDGPSSVLNGRERLVLWMGLRIAVLVIGVVEYLPPPTTGRSSSRSRRCLSVSHSSSTVAPSALATRPSPI